MFISAEIIFCVFLITSGFPHIDLQNTGVIFRETSSWSGQGFEKCYIYILNINIQLAEGALNLQSSWNVNFCFIFVDNTVLPCILNRSIIHKVLWNLSL